MRFWSVFVLGHVLSHVWDAQYWVTVTCYLITLDSRYISHTYCMLNKTLLVLLLSICSTHSCFLAFSCPYYCTHPRPLSGLYWWMCYILICLLHHKLVLPADGMLYMRAGLLTLSHTRVLFSMWAHRKFLNITGNDDQKKRLTLPYSLLWINIYILFFLEKKDFDSCIHSFTEKWPWPLILYSRIVFCFVFVL